jgi:DNA-directed RNA polymerase subunit RPC12/RpoP
MADSSSKSSLGLLLGLIVILAGLVFFQVKRSKPTFNDMRFRCNQCGAVVMAQPPEVPEQEIPRDANQAEIARILFEEHMARHNGGTCPECGQGELIAAPIFECLECGTYFEGKPELLKLDAIPCPKCKKLNTKQMPWDFEAPANLVLPQGTPKPKN